MSDNVAIANVANDVNAFSQGAFALVRRQCNALGYLTPAQYVQNQSGNDHEAIRLK